MVNGAQYNGPPDLVDPGGAGSMRRPLPERATSDFPIYSSALFHSPGPINGMRRLNVELNHRLMTVEKTYKGPTPAPEITPSTEGWDQFRVCVKGCSLGYLEITSVPAIINRAWSFSVDLKNGAVELNNG
jgi:hypothetical protein